MKYFLHKVSMKKKPRCMSQCFGVLCGQASRARGLSLIEAETPRVSFENPVSGRLLSKYFIYIVVQPDVRAVGFPPQQ